MTKVSFAPENRGKIARVTLPVAVNQLFDYHIAPNQDVTRGSLVEVWLNGKRRQGVVIEVLEETHVPPEKMKTLTKVSALPPLPEDVLKMSMFVADYYQVEVGIAHDLAVPPSSNPPGLTPKPSPLFLTDEGREKLVALREKKGSARVLTAMIDAVMSGNISIVAQKDATATGKKYLKSWRDLGWLIPAPPEKNGAFNAQTSAEKGEALPLFDEQQECVDEVAASFGRFQTFLLQGVTGSGKTEVYLALARRAIKKGAQVLIMVPEIHLTPQFLSRVKNALPDVPTAVLHSALTISERRNAWLDAAEGRARLVLGTRLSVFTPLPDLGLIVVDEEHDLSFKQQDGARYSARDLAIWRARERDAPILLGSATPSLESYKHAMSGQYAHLRIMRRAKEEAKLPKLILTPATFHTLKEGMAPPLWDAINTRLQKGEQSLIFINRRGYSPSIKCSSCSWESVCSQCSARLVYHQAPATLRCHYCGHTEKIPRSCPECGNLDLLPRGFGTQRLETALKAKFPNARIARIDRDTTQTRGAFAATREEIENREIDILIGTQMLAKGHDFPMITFVGVLGADNALYSADFRASERSFALLNQVSGRAGRGARLGEVMIQTDFAAHPLYQALERHDFDFYARALLQERRSFQLPPYTALALLEAECENEENLFSFLRQARSIGAAVIAAQNITDVDLFDPIAATLAKRANFFRAHIMARSVKRTSLQSFLKQWNTRLSETRAPRDVRFAFNVDPL